MSLSTMAGLLALVIGALLLGLRHQYAGRIPGLLPWGGALLMFTAGTAAFMLHRVLPVGLAMMLGNALLLFGSALLVLGSQRFLGRRMQWRPYLLLCACSLGVMAWFLFVVPDYRVRVSTFTGCLTVMALAHRRLLLCHGQGWASAFTAGVLLCFSVLMVARGVLTWWLDGPDTTIYMPSVVQGVYIATFGFAVLLLGIGILFMATERVRAEFERIASHDGLTHTLTRRSWMAAAQVALSGAGAGDPRVALLMLDVDDFKKINDEQGHQAGDAVLVALAGVLTQTAPAGSLVGRYGGEEFVVLLMDRSARHVRDVAEALRLAIASHPALGCTVSIGLAMAEEADRSMDRLIQRADGVLYQAKRQGRNRVVEAAEGGISAERVAA